MTSDSRSARLPPAGTVACVDLGKSSCRLRLVDVASGSGILERIGSGAPGLAETRGATRAAESIAVLLKQVSVGALRDVVGIVVGAAGTEAAPRAAQELARQLAQSHGLAVTVASDIVIAHAGAFAGAQGAVLVVGTGAVALALHADGSFHQADGWGPWAGDEGSGRWIGQEGIRLGLRSLDGRSRASLLGEAVRDVIGSPYEVPGWIAAGDNPAKTLASFAQIVIDLADAGDLQAVDVVARAVDALIESVTAASAARSDVAVVGGIATRSGFRETLDARLIEGGFRPRHETGGPLDGALLLATQPNTPYKEKSFHA